MTEEFKKSTLSTDGENISISFGFTKIDKEKRTVTGVATADNIDLEDDIIDYAGSKEAFKTWVGNIREMHGTKAVGKAVSSKEVVVRDEQGNTYNGFEVTSYISKGAQDTWEKILDGTLAGYSIGGRVLEKVKEFHKTNGKVVSRVKKYLLTELSVVDNPCNPLAQFTMIKGVGGGDAEVTMVVDTETVFYCSKCEIAAVNDSECSGCAGDMAEIGYIESEAQFSAEVVNKMIGDYDLKKSERSGMVFSTTNIEAKEVSHNNIEGVNLHNNNEDAIVNTMELTSEQKTTLMGKFAKWLFGAEGTELTVPLAVAEETEEVTKAVEAEVEADETKEEIMEKSETTEVATEVTEEVTETVEKSVEATTPALDMNALVEAINKSVSTAVSGAADGWKADFSVFGSKLDDLTGNVERVSKRLEDLETRVDSMGAVKKSIDVEAEEEVEVIEKSATSNDSLWGNSFVPQNVIEALGYQK